MALTDKPDAELRVVEPVAALFGHLGHQRRLATAGSPVKDQRHTRVIVQVPDRVQSSQQTIFLCIYCRVYIVKTDDADRTIKVRHPAIKAVLQY